MLGKEAPFNMFLSYHVASDLEHAEVLCESLTARGLRVWWDEEQLVTSELSLVLQRAIDADVSLDGSIQFGLHVDSLARTTEVLHQANLDVTLDREDLGHRQGVTVLRLPSGQTVEFVGG